MRSITLCCNVIVITGLLSFTEAGSPVYQEPVHFARTSTTSSSQSVTSNKISTSTTTYQSFAVDQPGAEVQSFPLTRDGVSCHYRYYGRSENGKSHSSNAVGKARAPRPLAHLSPFDCHVQCPTQPSAAPNKRDCQKVINAMKRAKKGSITIEPHSVFSVEYKECALIFENSSSQNVAVIYGWRQLAEQAARIQDQCYSVSPGGAHPSRNQSKSNGMCFFSSCDVEKSIQAYGSDGNSIRNSRGSSTSALENSGIMITFERKREVIFK